MNIITTYNKDELLAFAETNYRSATESFSMMRELRLDNSWLDLDARVKSYELLIKLLNRYGNSSNKSLKEEKDCCIVLFDLINNTYVLSYQKN